MGENIKVGQLKPVYPSEEHENVRALLDFTAEKYGEDKAFLLKEKRARKGEVQEYREVTYRQLREDVQALGTGLCAMGVRDMRIAVIGENSYKWQLTYLATMCGLGVLVPLDKGLPYAELRTSIDKSRSRVLVFDRKHRALADQLKQEGSSVDTFICMESGSEFLCFEQILEHGRRLLSQGDKAFLELPIDREQVSTLIFTSGTTSAAKAVMLNQRNVMFNIYTMKKVEDIRRGDVNIALLPYHHTFGSTCQLLMYACGSTTVFCDGLKYLQKNFQEYHVSVFVGVPLLMEAMYKKILAAVRKQDKEKTFRRGIRIAGLLHKVGIDVRRRLFKDILKELGGDLRMVVSGASALDAAVTRGWSELGVEVVQGYGMTESAPVIACENLFTRSPGSIGLGLPGVDVEIDDPNEEGIGEIIARSPSVMLGYYEEPEETAKVLRDGWLHTGDLAYLDKKGCIHICGRSKNVIVLKNGKNVYPEEIETIIEELPYVKENIIFSEVRREGADDKDQVLVAKIVYDPEIMEEDYGAATEEQVRAVVSADLDRINENMPKYKNIHRFTVQTEEMVKTTTGKVKRYQERQ